MHEEIKLTWEDMHSIKMEKIPTTIIKIDFYKAYDKVSWLFLSFFLLHNWFSFELVSWIMGCAVDYWDPDSETFHIDRMSLSIEVEDIYFIIGLSE